MSKFSSFDFKSDNNFDENDGNQLAPINEISKYNIISRKTLYKACNESKYIRLIKLKKIILIT